MIKKMSKMTLKYLEGLIYCALLLVSVMICISGNMYIKMIPVAFISGLIGQMMFGKKAMTSIFSCIVAIILLQVKIPGMLVQNITTTVVITVLSLIGELCGFSFKKLIHLLKLKTTKRREKEKLKHYIICTITLIIAIVLNGIVNGNPISYYRCKKNLNSYLAKEYASTSRFKIFSSRYSLENKPKFTFYTKDVLSNNDIGKFTVYLDDRLSIKDDYKAKVLNDKIRDISKEIENLEFNENVTVSIGLSENDEVSLNISKKIQEVNDENVNLFSNEVVDVINKIRTIKNYEVIRQMEIVLECVENEQNSLATYVYMDGYNDMMQRNEDASEYIKRALYVEYIY